MKEFATDEYGVPYIKDPTIEEIAAELLAEFDKELLTVPQKLPALMFLDYLKNKYELTFALKNLGSRDGQKILGQTLLLKNTILLADDILDIPEHLFLTTVAHEIGHWKLHSNRKIRLPSGSEPAEEEPLEVLVDYDTEKGLCYVDLVGKKKQLQHPVDWIEHQAKVFAAALLMPAPAFLRTIELAQRELDLPWKGGKIYLNKAGYSQKETTSTFEIIHQYFGTSITAVRIRAQTLKLIVDQRGVKPDSGGNLYSVQSALRSSRES